MIFTFSTITDSVELYDNNENKGVNNSIEVNNSSDIINTEKTDMNNQSSTNKESYLEENNVVIDNIRLLMYEEALTLGCNEGSCVSAPSWVYYSTYWTGSVASDSGDVWCITTTAEFKGSKYTNADRGIRPVIEISKSYF